MRKAYLLVLTLIALLTFSGQKANAQGSADYGDGIKIKINEDGSKYVRILGWTQVQSQYTDAPGTADNQIDMQLKRMRMIVYSQMNKNFMVFTHFGVNGLKPNSATPDSKLTLLNAWVEYNILKATKEDPTSLTAGAGYHYWNGISRMAMASTINLLTLDIVNPMPNQLNGTGQFGYFLKGNVDKFGYNFAFNEPTTTGAAVTPGTTAKFNTQNRQWAYTSYLHYQFGDAESMFLPYRVGSYVGTKTILNVGVGCYYNPDGSVQVNGSGKVEKKAHVIISADVFADQPIGDDMAVTAYGVFYSANYGKDYVGGTTFASLGTGTTIYAQAGLLLPKDIIGDLGRLQPFVGFTNKNFDALDKSYSQYDLGLNWFIEGQNAKITCQYSSIPVVSPNSSDLVNKGQFTILAAVSL